jgi:hypothetical protein
VHSKTKVGIAPTFSWFVSKDGRRRAAEVDSGILANRKIFQNFPAKLLIPQF